MLKTVIKMPDIQRLNMKTLVAIRSLIHRMMATHTMIFSVMEKNIKVASSVAASAEPVN